MAKTTTLRSQIIRENSNVHTLEYNSTNNTISWYRCILKIKKSQSKLRF
jgi:hypothetical protein